MSRWIALALLAAACADPQATDEAASEGIVLGEDTMPGEDTEPWPDGPGFVDVGIPEPEPPIEVAPRPTRGGTMLASRDGMRMFVGDPDRDLFFVVDIAARSITLEIAFDDGAEPGRIVEGGQDRVHVVLRRTGEVATVDVAAGEIVARRRACAGATGLALDADGALLVSCTHGMLVRLHADGTEQRIDVGLDLGDIVDAGPPVRVATTRSPRVVTLDDDGAIVRSQAPRTVGVKDGELVMTEPGEAYPEDTFDEVLTPNSTRRVIPATGALGDDAPGKARPSWVMLHQAASGRPLRPEPDGYGSGACIPAQATVVSHGAFDDDVVRSWPLDSIAPAFDVAITPDGTLGAVIGGITTAWGIAFVTDDFTPRDVGPAPCEPRDSVRLPAQPISVAFDPEGRAWVQLREPSSLIVVDPEAREVVDEVMLSDESVHDVGHDLFHLSTSSMLACVSCHPDGGDDGRIWTFEEIGARRTQPLAVRLGGSEPLHWRGELGDFADLALEVRGERMGGGDLERDEVEALERWVYALASPEVPTEDLDLDAVERGRALFDELGCDVCHAGDRLTNDATVQLGQRGWLQVPSLIGVVSRGPWMHDGRSPTIEAAIEDMLTVGGAGAVVLGDTEMRDLVEFLRSAG